MKKITMILLSLLIGFSAFAQDLAFLDNQILETKKQAENAEKKVKGSLHKKLKKAGLKPFRLIDKKTFLKKKE